jgi:hypothetical protein
MDNGNCSHLILQDLESNIFQIIIWTSLQLTGKEANGQQSDMLNTKKMILPFLKAQKGIKRLQTGIYSESFFLKKKKKEKKKWQVYKP